MLQAPIKSAEKKHIAVFIIVFSENSESLILFLIMKMRKKVIKGINSAANIQERAAPEKKKTALLPEQAHSIDNPNGEMPIFIFDIPKANAERKQKICRSVFDAALVLFLVFKSYGDKHLNITEPRHCIYIFMLFAVLLCRFAVYEFLLFVCKIFRRPLFFI